MRRFKQQLPGEETERILHKGKYCVMAVSGDDDYPYAVPVNYVYEGTAFIYIRQRRGIRLMPSDAIRNVRCASLTKMMRYRKNSPLNASSG